DEAQSFSESSLPVNVSNTAALMATDFSWTERAAAARDGFRVPRGAVGRIRELIEDQHRVISEAERRYTDRLRHADAEKIRELEQIRSIANTFPRVDVLNWRGGRS